MSIFRFQIQSILWMSVLALSCKAYREPTSEVLYGHHDRLIRTSLYIVPPTGKIAVCSDDTKDNELMSNAIKSWMLAVGRETSVKVVSTCFALEEYDGVVFTYVHPVGELLESCKTGALAFARNLSPGTEGQMQLRTNLGGVVVRCKKENTEGGEYSTYLHESGHLMGLCDQYSEDPKGKVEAIGMHNTCSKIYRSEVAKASVMNAGADTPTELTPDDIEGAKSVVARINDARWRDTLVPPSQTPLNGIPTVVDPILGSQPTSPFPTNPLPTQTTPQTNVEPPAAQPTGGTTLDCNRDYARIRSSQESGVCLNSSSGLCYRYGRGDVQYSEGQVTCSGHGPTNPTVRPSPAQSPNTTNPVAGSKLDCNADYSQIRRSAASGTCINRSSGLCYSYGNGDVQYNLGPRTCPQ